MTTIGPWGARPASDVLWEPEKIDLVIRNAVARRQADYDRRMLVRLALLAVYAVPAAAAGGVLFALLRYVNHF